MKEKRKKMISLFTNFYLKLYNDPKDDNKCFEKLGA